MRPWRKTSPCKGCLTQTRRGGKDWSGTEHPRQRKQHSEVPRSKGEAGEWVKGGNTRHQGQQSTNEDTGSDSRMAYGVKKETSLAADNNVGEIGRARTGLHRDSS